MIQRQPVKTKLLHLMRAVFKIPMLEGWLARRVRGAPMSSLIYKVVPHSYTYPAGTYRILEENGLKFRLDISDFLGHAVYFGYDNEEARSYRQLVALVQKGFCCLDVGANIGYVAHQLARAAYPGKVIGFEPDPLNYSRAMENIALNNLPNLTVLPYGLGDKEQSAVMEVRATYNLGGNRIAKEGATGDAVEIKTLDEIARGVIGGRVDLIKIDVEGYELKVLRGASWLLMQFHPVLFVEINDDNLGYQGDSAKGLITFLMETGYQHFENARDGAAISIATDFAGMHFDLIARR